MLGLEGEGTTEDLEYTVETVACIGCCALAPAVTYNEEVHGNLTKNKVRKLLKEEASKNGQINEPFSSAGGPAANRPNQLIFRPN